MQNFRFGQKRFQDIEGIRKFLRQIMSQLLPEVVEVARSFELRVEVQLAEKPWRLHIVWRRLDAKAFNQAMIKQISEQFTAISKSYDNFFVFFPPSKVQRPRILIMEMRIDDFTNFTLKQDGQEDRDPYFPAVID